jgi:DNA-binding NarL/FixJ family response regulator
MAMEDVRPHVRAQVLVVTADEGLAQRVGEDLGLLIRMTHAGTVQAGRAAIATTRWRGVLVDLASRSAPAVDFVEYARVGQPDAELLVLADALDATVANRVASVGALMATKPCDGDVVQEFLTRCWRAEASELDRLPRSLGWRPGAPEVSRWARRKVVHREAERCGLTPRETEILTLLVEGQPWQDVAEDLGISRRTYATHVSRILRKTGADGVGSLVIALLLLAQNEGVRAARLTLPG